MEPIRTQRTRRPAGAPEKLSAREQRFASEYLVDLCGGAAALRAGYNQSPASARVTASRLLTKPSVQAAVAAGQRRHLQAAAVRGEAVIRELARIAFANIRDLLDDGGKIRQVGMWPAGTARAVSNVAADDGAITRIRLHDKLGALSLLARHLGLLSPKAAPGDVVLRWQD